MIPEHVGRDASLVQPESVVGRPNLSVFGLGPALVRSDLELVGPEPGGGALGPDLVGFDLFVLASDVFVFPSDPYGGGPKLRGVRSEYVGFRLKKVGLESALFDSPSAIVGILSTRFGILSADVGFQSAACALRLAMDESRETSQLSLDPAFGPLVVTAGCVHAPSVASNRYDP